MKTPQEQPINTAIIGFGTAAQFMHVPFLKALPQKFLWHAVVERHTSIANQYPKNIRIFRNYTELLADDSIELVLVTTPNNTHYDFAKQALLANKHVVVEKPFTSTLAEAQELFGLAKQQQKIITAYQNRRFDADFLTIQRLINNHELGEILMYEAHFDRFRPNIRPQAWKEKPMPASGSWYDLGSHLLDQALLLFGKPQYITACLRTQRQNSTIDDYFNIRLEYTHNLVVYLTSSMIIRQQVPRFQIHGTKGSFIKSGLDPQENRLRLEDQAVSGSLGKETADNFGILHTDTFQGNVPSETGDYRIFYQQLYNHIRHNQAFNITTQQILWQIELLELAKKSSAERRSIQVF